MFKQFPEIYFSAPALSGVEEDLNGV